MDFLDRNCGENSVEKRETLGSLRSMISKKDIASIIEHWLAHKGSNKYIYIMYF